jgi:hypothetical protein
MTTALFFGPMLSRRSEDAGLLYTGDVLGLYWPAMLKTHSLLSQGFFSAVDYSSYNGSSDYFVVPNFFMLHPLVVAYALLVPAGGDLMRELGHWLVIVMALHAMFACYCTHRLLDRWYGLGFWPAALAATTFTFSLNVMMSLGQPMFLFCVSAMPCVAYAALWFAERPTWTRLVLASIPAIFGFMAGYVPLAVTAIGLATLLAAIPIFLRNYAPRDLSSEVNLSTALQGFAKSVLPVLLASIVVLPYYAAVYLHVRASISANTPSLFYSAHQLAQDPTSVLNHFSGFLQPPGPFYEFRFVAGAIAISVVLLFACSESCRAALSAWEWRLLQISGVVYFLVALATFGNVSPVSDLVYYLVPQVGGMHIYQRFLLFTQLFLTTSVAIMLRAIISVRPTRAISVGIIGATAMVFAAAQALSRFPVVMHSQGINSYVLYELLLCALFLLALLAPSRGFVFAVTLVLSLLPSLDSVYDLASGGNKLVEQRTHHPMALQRPEQDRLLAWIANLPQADQKEVIKYVDLTKLWAETGREPFPKSFPWLVLDRARLSSYHGFDFRMGPTARYLERMPMAVRDGTWVLNPDWDTVTAANADFLITYDTDFQSGMLAAVCGNVPREACLAIPGGLLAVPLPQSNAEHGDGLPPSLDNGVFQILARHGPEDEVLENVALGRQAKLSSVFLERPAALAVDGDTNGSLTGNSIAHSGCDPNAWLDIDLGQTRCIREVRLWNVNGYESRLSDAWVFISDDPFRPEDTADTLSRREKTWHARRHSTRRTASIDAEGARGRYVRVQLGGHASGSQAYLHVAEIEVLACSDDSQNVVDITGHETGPRLLEYQSNLANRTRVAWESDTVTEVRYLFSSNPRLTYFLDGAEVIPGERAGLVAFTTGPGRHTLEVRYRHGLLQAFWFGLAAYTVACALAAAISVAGQLYSPRAVVIR